MDCELGRMAEYRALSVDGSFKAVRSILPKTTYRDKAELKKEVQSITCVGPEHACISVVGAHGRLLALHLAAPEGIDSIVAAVCEAAPADSRVDTYHISTDNPSHKLAHSLHNVLPNLKLLSIEAIHLSFSAITSCMAQKNAAGKSRAIRKLVS